MLLTISEDCLGLVSHFLDTHELNDVMRTCRQFQRLVTFRMVIDCKKRTEARYKHAIPMTSQGGNFIRFFSSQGRRTYDMYAVPRELNSMYYGEQQYIFKAPGNELLRGKIIHIEEARAGEIFRERDFRSSGNDSIFTCKEIKVNYILERIKEDRRTLSSRFTASFNRDAGMQGTDDFEMLIIAEQCVAYAPFHVIERFRRKRKAHVKVCLPTFMM
jgi:hypothetical protein